MRPVKFTGLASEILSSAGPARPACAACGLWGTCRSPGMRPFVPKGYTGRLLVVGEAAGKEEDDPVANRPFVGAAGRLLRKLLRECGFADSDVAFVNAVRCRPPKNATPPMRSVRACRPYLLRVVETLHPRSVVGVGATALRGLTNDGSRQNVTSERGRDLSGQVPGLSGRIREERGEEPPASHSGLPGSHSPLSVWITYHPAAVLYPGGSHLPVYIREDLRRAGRGEGEVVPVGPDQSGIIAGGCRAVGVDTEWAPDGALLTVGVSDGKGAVAYETT